jgi:hypothetical protein
MPASAAEQDAAENRSVVFSRILVVENYFFAYPLARNITINNPKL